jgi:hypothetical protein
MIEPSPCRAAHSGPPTPAVPRPGALVDPQLQWGDAPARLYRLRDASGVAWEHADADYLRLYLHRTEQRIRGEPLARSG